MNKLYDLPKDLLIKIIETIQKDKDIQNEKEYSNYMLIEMKEYDVGCKQFNDEMELREFMLQQISFYGLLLSEDVSLEVILDEYAYCINSKIKIMKGKFL